MDESGPSSLSLSTIHGFNLFLASSAVSLLETLPHLHTQKVKFMITTQQSTSSPNISTPSISGPLIDVSLMLDIHDRGNQVLILPHTLGIAPCSPPGHTSEQNERQVAKGCVINLLIWSHLRIFSCVSICGGLQGEAKSVRPQVYKHLILQFSGTTKKAGIDNLKVELQIFPKFKKKSWCL